MTPYRCIASVRISHSPYSFTVQEEGLYVWIPETIISFSYSKKLHIPSKVFVKLYISLHKWKIKICKYACIKCWHVVNLSLEHVPHSFCFSYKAFGFKVFLHYIQGFPCVWKTLSFKNIASGLPWQSSTGGVGSIPGQAAKIPHASWPKNQNRKQKPYCNKFHKDFKNCPHQKKIF